MTFIKKIYGGEIFRIGRVKRERKEKPPGLPLRPLSDTKIKDFYMENNVLEKLHQEKGRRKWLTK